MGAGEESVVRSSPAQVACQLRKAAHGDATHGFGSQLPAPILTPPEALHSAALFSSHSGPSSSSSGRQQRMSLVGGVVGQGLGKHVPVPMFAPPSFVHSSAVVSSHSDPSSSGRQHCTSP